MIKITPGIAADAVNQVVGTVGPDYVYNYSMCTYFGVNSDEGGVEPRCIVGRALANIGVPISTLEKMDDWGKVYNVPESFWTDNGIEICRDAIIVFTVAQDVSDRRKSWDNAASAASAASWACETTAEQWED